MSRMRKGALKGRRRVIKEKEEMDVWLGKVDEAIWERGFNLPCREADPQNHRDDKVDSDQ